MNQDPAAVRKDLHPARYVAFAVSLAVDDVRGLVLHLLTEVDDVMRSDPIGGDVDLLAIDQEVAVHHKLTGLPAGTSQPGTIDHIVEAGLQDLEQVVARLALQPVGLLVIAAELLLEHAVGEARLLLLTKLQGVFRLLGASLAVDAGWVGAALERPVSADQINTQST